MTLHQSNAAKGIENVPYPGTAGEVVARRYAFSAPATIAKDDIIELAPIPPGCRVLDMIVDSDQLDSGGTAAILIDVGVMSGNWGDDDANRTCGDEFFDGDDVAQAGGTARMSSSDGFRVAPAATARSIGVKVATAAATGKAGEIALIVFLAAG